MADTSLVLDTAKRTAETTTRAITGQQKRRLKIIK